MGNYRVKIRVRAATKAGTPSSQSMTVGVYNVNQEANVLTRSILGNELGTNYYALNILIKS